MKTHIHHLGGYRTEQSSGSAHLSKTHPRAGSTIFHPQQPARMTRSAESCKRRVPETRGSGNGSMEKSQWTTEKLCLAEQLFLLLSSYPSPSSSPAPTCALPGGLCCCRDRYTHPTCARHTEGQFGLACACHAPARRAGGQFYPSFIPTSSAGLGKARRGSPCPLPR